MPRDQAERTALEEILQKRYAVLGGEGPLRLQRSGVHVSLRGKPIADPQNAQSFKAYSDQTEAFVKEALRAVDELNADCCALHQFEAAFGPPSLEITQSIAKPRK